MDRRVIYVLEQLYNKDEEYVKSDMYSNKDRQVYTHKDNEALWLCFEQMNKMQIDVTKTYDNGTVSMCDKYRLEDDGLQQFNHEEFRDKRKEPRSLEERIAEKKAIIKAREEAKKAKQKNNERN